MVVAINIVQFGREPIENVVVSIFSKIASERSKDTFIIIHSAAFGHLPSLSNVELVLSPAVLNSNYLGWFKYQKSISSLLKTFSVDVLITPFIFSKLIWKKEQVLLLSGLGNFIDRNYFSKVSNSFFTSYVLKGIKKADRIITSSEEWKKVLVDKFEKNIESVIVVDSSILNLERQISFEESITGEAFFLLIDPLINHDKLVFVLKAFSGFKKRLKSSMKLVVVYTADRVVSLEKAVKAYKYKSDVVFKSGDLDKFISNSYATIFNSKYSGFDNIAAGVSRLKSVGIFVESAYNNSINSLIYKDGDISSLSERMMEIYKDEGLRTRMVEGGVAVCDLKDFMFFMEKVV